MSFPFAVLVISAVSLGLSLFAGDVLRRKIHPLDDEQRKDFDIVLGSTLTLLSLLLGFSFSMAISRYDQRKTYEEEEANAIGTAYLRAQLLPESNTARIRELLRKYLDERIAYYTADDRLQALKSSAATATLQNELWSAAQLPAGTQVTVGPSLAIQGMNAVLDAQGYAQAAFRNRIPAAAWALMGCIAVCSSLMLGYGARRKDWRMLLVIPTIVSIALFLIADIDSPRGGTIKVPPENLQSLGDSLARTGTVSQP
jgi:hypothetical protein